MYIHTTDPRTRQDNYLIIGYIRDEQHYNQIGLTEEQTHGNMFFRRYL